MENKAAVDAAGLDPSLESITSNLRSFIEMSLQQDDRAWDDWIASIGKNVEFRCWEEKNCAKTDCPAYKSESGRCWLLAGSLNGSNLVGKHRAGITNCCECEIYQINVCKDPVSEIQEQIITLIHNLHSRQQELKELAIHDPLTGLKNRRFFDMYIPHEVERVNRNRDTMALVVIDVDGFNEINAVHGRIFRDKILKECAAILEKEIRGTDLLFRFEVNEFLVVMSKAGDREAEILIQRINDRLEAWKGVHNSKGLRISFCAGYALLTHNRELFEVMSEADLSMYEAKKRRKEMAVVA